MTETPQAAKDVAIAAARQFWNAEPESMHEEIDGSALAILAAVEPIIAAHALSAEAAVWAAKSATIAREAHAAERERLFVAIRHALPLSAPWRGEALDLIAGVWQQPKDGEQV